MTRHTLEKYQVLVYLAAIIVGLLFGITSPEAGSILETLLWPVLGLLLYVTFTQVSFLKLRMAFKDLRFITVAVVGNFVLIPILIWVILQLLPDIPAIQLGVALVLLVPCTDWFITFTQLGGGDTEQSIIFSPVSLLLQIVLLPLYLLLFFGQEMTVSLATDSMFFAFFGIIVLPLIVAYLTEKWAERSSHNQNVITFLGWFPVPLLAVVIFLIAASQAHVLTDATFVLIYPAFAFISFLVITAFLSKVLAKVASLPVRQGRVLAFSLGSRNSFVVLPLALAMPDSFEIAVFVIVLQSFIELFGMVIYVWVIPNYLFTED